MVTSCYTYRVFKKSCRKRIANFSKNMSANVFLSLLGAHQMWSIWQNMPPKFLDDFLKSIQAWRKRCIIVKVLIFWCLFLLFWRGRYLWLHFSQPFLDQIIMFFYFLKRKLPELFKTHPTFISGPFLRAPKSFSSNWSIYNISLWGTL